MKIRMIYFYLMHLLFRSMGNHIATKGGAKEMHEYLSEVYKGKLRRALERAHDRLTKQ